MRTGERDVLWCRRDSCVDYICDGNGSSSEPFEHVGVEQQEVVELDGFGIRAGGGCLCLVLVPAAAAARASENNDLRAAFYQTRAVAVARNFMSDITAPAAACTGGLARQHFPTQAAYTHEQ